MSCTSARTSSSSLLSSCHNSSLSVASKPFFTRTSSIADDETTLCPSIPNSISFRSLDDLTVASGPSIDLIHTCETQQQANMSIGPTNSPPINHQDFENPPPPGDTEADAVSAASGVPNVETASSEETEANETIQGTPIDHKAARSAKKASPTTPIELVHQLEAMMAQMQDNLLARQQESIEKIMAETVAPKLKQMDDLQAKLFPQGSPTTSPARPQAPVPEVHCPVSEDSPSKRSFTSATNSSTTASKVPTSPSRACPLPPQANPPPGFASRTQAPHKPSGFSMPTGNVFESQPNLGAVYVKATATVKAIKKAQASATMTDNGDIKMQTVGTALAQAVSGVCGDVQVQLLKFRELTPTKASNPDDVRIQGQFLLGTLSCYSTSPAEQVAILQERIQHVIHNKTVASLPNYPSYVSAFSFDINSVNSAEQMIFALVEGPRGIWFDPKDHFGIDHFIEEIVKHVPLDANGELPRCLRTKLDRQRNIGGLVYTSSKVRENGRFGKAYALVYAQTDDGQAAAQYILSAYANDRVVTVCGGIPISISAFPSNNNSNGSPPKSP
jgi:hypothetical protein